MKLNFLTSILLITFLTLSCSKDDAKVIQPEAFTFGDVAGMSSGATSVAGTTAPTGYTWSEVKLPQSTWGINGIVNDRQLADDFKIPAGEKWTIENFYFYSYQTSFSGTLFPVNEFYYEIYSSDPAIAGAEKVYGDMITNRFVSSEETKWYRILQGQTDTTTRKIYKMKIKAENLVLNPGTYWIKWGSKTSTGTHFYPQFPHDPSKENNAQQFVVTSSNWLDLNDGGQRVSFPFEISGTKLPN